MRLNAVTLLAGLPITGVIAPAFAPAFADAVAVAPQYSSTHVYVSPEDVDRFAASFLATFGGKSTRQAVADVTPTPSLTSTQLLQTPVGMVSLFGFRTPIPYPFGFERTGDLVSDLDEAVREARAAGADIIVAPFTDPIGRDAIVQWPGGVTMQFYWHNSKPNYPVLHTIPDNRVYLSPDRADAFIAAFLAFSHGKIAHDGSTAPGAAAVLPPGRLRCVRIASAFGRMVVIVTDGHLPYPYGRETTGHEVADLNATLAKARASGAEILAGPAMSGGTMEAMLRFPGGYIAEVHQSPTAGGEH